MSKKSQGDGLNEFGLRDGPEDDGREASADDVGDVGELGDHGELGTNAAAKGAARSAAKGSSRKRAAKKGGKGAARKRRPAD